MFEESVPYFYAWLGPEHELEPEPGVFGSLEPELDPLEEKKNSRMEKSQKLELLKN